METENVKIPEEFEAAVTGRWVNYQNALRVGISVLITTARSNLQAYALNPCSASLSRDSTPPDAWEWKATVTTASGQTVTDAASIYPGIVEQQDGSLTLVYPVL